MANFDDFIYYILEQQYTRPGVGGQGPITYQTTAQRPGEAPRDVSHDPRYANAGANISAEIARRQAARAPQGPSQQVGSAAGGSSNADFAGPATQAAPARPMPQMPQQPAAHPPVAQQPGVRPQQPGSYEGSASGGSSNLDF